MKKLTVVAAALAAALSLAAIADAGAKAKAPGSVKFYGFEGISGTKAIGFGQLFSPRASCVDGRKFKAVAKGPGVKVTLDGGRTSGEGAFAALFKVDDLTGADRIDFIFAKTKKCAKVTDAPPLNRIAAAKPAVPTEIKIAVIDGIGKNGAVSGFVKAGSSSCKSERSVELFTDGKARDAGTTSKNGGWALHLTKNEFDKAEKFKVVVAPNSKCGGAKATVKKLIVRQRWR